VKLTLAKLRIENLSKSFYKKTVLKDISMEVPDQSFTSILGPPGAGKTTLLRIIAGVESPDKGKIYLDDVDITRLPPKDRDIAMVYQTFALYPHMTVYENVANPLKAKKLPEEEIKKRVRKVTEFLKISHLLSRYPRELSGGEKQRVAIARALVREAKIYLFDEPLTNLDYKLRESARAELKRMCRELKSTIIYATPDPIDALTMSDYVYILLDGKIEQHGPTKKVYDSPANIEVAKCFSSPPINLINCDIRRKDNRLLLKTPFIEVDVTSWNVSEGSYILGIKPHHIVISREKPKGEISFKGSLHLTYVIGSETIGYVEARGVDLTVHLPYIYRISGRQEVWVSFNKDCLLLFDKESGERVVPGE